MVRNVGKWFADGLHGFLCFSHIFFSGCFQKLGVSLMVSNRYFAETKR